MSLEMEDRYLQVVADKHKKNQNNFLKIIDKINTKGNDATKAELVYRDILQSTIIPEPDYTKRRVGAMARALVI